LKKGKLLEEYVQFVYSNLLKLMNDTDTVVSTNVSIKGLLAVHEFDVYYEFYHLNTRHRVAIECKDWAAPVDIGKVRDFAAKLDDVNNIVGVMVAKSGYQKGAKEFAQGKGILLLENKDLPSIEEIVAGVIKKGFLPDKNVIGDPFWTLMEIKDGKITGTYYSFSNNKRQSIALFFSKRIAEHLLKRMDANDFEVRGVSRYQLKSIIGLMEVKGIDASICHIPFWSEEMNIHTLENCVFFKISSEDMRTNFIDL